MTWINTPLFDMDGRDTAERIIKSGACCVCRCIQGTWRRVEDNILVPSRGKPTLGFWERNRSLTKVQMKEIAIKEAGLWNSLACHYGRDLLVIKSVPLLPLLERQTLLLKFFLEAEDNPDPGQPGTFLCQHCDKRMPLTKRCTKHGCKEDCSFAVWCFDCAWVYTNGVWKGEIGVRSSNALNPRTSTIGMFKFGCEGCQQRGMYRRFDGQVLDDTHGFCYSASLQWVASLTKE
jgi:hypothetical protein